jgi:hypothetical protein
LRITQDLLQKYARETIKRRLRGELDLQAAYLTGSVLSDSPLLGGTTDIDLVLVHKYQILVTRECQRLTPEVSLDVFHTLRDDYEDHKHLRHDPFLGYPLTNNNILLYDHEHWLEFIQAGVSANFHRPDNVLVRVNGLLSEARERWLELMQSPDTSYQDWLEGYLGILSLAANAVAGLIGPPLTTRRFLLDFKARVDTLGTPKVLVGFYGLLGWSDAVNEHLLDWIDAFGGDLASLPEDSNLPVQLAPCRHRYYLDAIKALAESASPEQAVWPLFHTWLDVQLASKNTLPHAKLWESFLEALGLTSDNASQKIEALDAYLDSLEMIIESWSDEYGL